MLPHHYWGYCIEVAIYYSSILSVVQSVGLFRPSLRSLLKE